jgi:LAO/AO transport system kinase
MVDASEPDRDLAQAVVAGDRRALARAITLIESTRTDHRAEAERLLGALLPHSGQSIRVGISGVPGVGKSTFIEALGLHVIGAGHRVAVLAVDPSSPISGGSILGDKTRMENLAREPKAFIRPSPTSGTLGGVARRTREAMLVCEAAGFDVVFVETVGVGQSETAVADLVDMFLLLLAPGAGDDLQGIKRGIVELADLIVVNKADGDLAAAAERARRDYAAALHMLRPPSALWAPSVVKCSAAFGDGIDGVWEQVAAYRATPGMADDIAERRRRQASAWMWSEVHETLVAQLAEARRVGDLVAEREAAVLAGETTPSEAARAILDAFLGGAPGTDKPPRRSESE